MLPTLFGRLQTRIFLLATVGVVVTALVTPLLPGVGLPLGELYQVTFLVLGMVIVLGILWEFLYHFLMQFRWEKDWPTLFGLLTVINEGLLLWALLYFDLLPFIDPAPPTLAFAIHFVAVWLAQFVVANTTMRIMFTRWRFHGGRLV